MKRLFAIAMAGSAAISASFVALPAAAQVADPGDPYCWAQELVYECSRKTGECTLVEIVLTPVPC